MKYSALESQRFGLTIYRGNADKLDAHGLMRTIVDNKVDVVVLRLPSTEQHSLYKLNDLGYPIIVADTLVYYDCDLTTNPALPLRNIDLQTRLATDVDRPLLSELIDVIFKDYSTHYYSNPIFDRQHILDGYKEWSLGYLQPDNGRLCFLFYRGEQAIAFATCALHPAYGEGILYGVHPSAQGGGIYGDLIRYTKQYMQQQGINKMRVSTQVQNYAVQKVWMREGFFMTQAYCTVHVNALLSQSQS